MPASPQRATMRSWGFKCRAVTVVSRLSLSSGRTEASPRACWMRALGQNSLVSAIAFQDRNLAELADFFQPFLVLIDHHKDVPRLQELFDEVRAGLTRAADDEMIVHIPNQFLHLASPKNMVEFAFHNEGGGSGKSVQHDPDANRG